MLRSHRAGKGPGDYGGWGLVSEGRGPHLGAQQASWAQVGRTHAFLSSPALPIWEGPSRLPLQFSPQPPSYAPKDPGDLDGALEVGVPAWELSSLLCPSGPGYGPLLLSGSCPRVPPACLLISPASGVPILSGLHFSPTQSPCVLPVHLGVPPLSLGVRVPHQWPAGALVVGRS